MFILVFTVLAVLLSLLSVIKGWGKVGRNSNYEDFIKLSDNELATMSAFLSHNDTEEESDYSLSEFNVIRRREKKKWLERNIRDNKHIVLFIGAEIKGLAHIGIKEDCETIRGALAGSEVFHVIEKSSVSREEFVPLISKYAPSILHFDGHGSEDGKLAFKGVDGKYDLIAPEEISGVLNIASKYMKVAFFDACYSSRHAQYAVLSIDAAIGNEGKWSAHTARTFARQFYCSLEDGHSVADAYGFAKEQVKMVERDSKPSCPILETKVKVEAVKIKFVKKENLT